MSDAVMVPREPTEAMLRAGANAPYPCDAVDVWKAMLAASPSVGGWDERLSIITEALKTKLTEAKINCDGSDEMVAYTQGVIDTYEFCREAVSAPPPVSVGGWEDISTAPKDGTLVDLWASYGERVAGAKWTNGVWREWALDGFDSMGWVRLEGTATHWMPLPPPPVSTGSRPQEAVPAEQADGAVVADLRLILAANRKMAEALAASPSVGGWEDISTAPKDGTVVDLWRAETGRWPDCYWGHPHHECGEMGSLCDSDEHPSPDDAPTWVCGTFNQRIGYPHNPVTHWMPLPPPASVSTGSRPQEAVPAEQADAAVVGLLNQISALCTAFNDQMHDADDTLGQINQLAYAGIAAIIPASVRAGQ